MSDPIHTYEGEQVDVTWDGRVCLHIGECGRAEGELFVGGRDPWCQPDVTDPEAAVEVVERCPTGAIAYRRKDGGPAETPPEENTIVVSKQGPLYLRGALRIEGAGDDMPGVATRAALCRCGQSSNKPFCDNTHERIPFSDRGAVGEAGPGLEDAGEGPLEVSLASDGPLLLKGPATVIASSGQRRWTGRKTALCRCGHSGNKPFCDGSHARKGWSADETA